MTLHSSRSLVEFQLTCQESAISKSDANADNIAYWGRIDKVAPLKRQAYEHCVVDIIAAERR